MSTTATSKAAQFRIRELVLAKTAHEHASSGICEDDKYELESLITCFPNLVDMEVTVLQQCHPDCERFNRKDYPLLHWFCCIHDPKLVEFLVDAGADVLLPNKSDNLYTPLKYWLDSTHGCPHVVHALQNDSDKVEFMHIVKLLIKKGAMETSSVNLIKCALEHRNSSSLMRMLLENRTDRMHPLGGSLLSDFLKYNISRYNPVEAHEVVRLLIGNGCKIEFSGTGMSTKSCDFYDFQ